MTVDSKQIKSVQNIGPNANIVQIDPAPPVTDEVLMATSSTTAEWKNLATSAYGQYSIDLQSTVDQSIPDGFVLPTAIDFDQENSKVGLTHSNVTNPSRVTTPITGRYVLTTSIEFDISSTGLRRILYKINGSSGEVGDQVQPIPGTETTILRGVWIVSLTAGDYIEISILQNSGAALDIISGTGTFLQMALLPGQ